MRKIAQKLDGALMRFFCWGMDKEGASILRQQMKTESPETPTYARDPLWDEFRKADFPRWCCGVLGELKSELGPLHVTFTVDGAVCNMPVTHCPQCGRKLR